MVATSSDLDRSLKHSLLLGEAMRRALQAFSAAFGSDLSFQILTAMLEICYPQMTSW